MNITFGPIHSRRFGTSLGVDLSPGIKQCNFDCLYCELKGAKAVEKMSEIAPLGVVVDAIKTALNAHAGIDVLTFTANGEPTLYPFLGELIVEIKAFLESEFAPKTRPKTLILSNGSRFDEPAIRAALCHFDIVKFSLDSISPRNFKRVDRAHKSVSLEAIKRGIKAFSSEFCGELVCEILIVKGVNDDLAELSELAEFLRGVHISRVDLGTIDRPPAYRVLPVSDEFLETAAKLFAPLSVNLPKREVDLTNAETKDGLDAVASLDFVSAKIAKLDSAPVKNFLNTLQKRPLTAQESSALLPQETLNFLLKSNIIIQTKLNDIVFYKLP